MIGEKRVLIQNTATAHYVSNQRGWTPYTSNARVFTNEAEAAAFLLKYGVATANLIVWSGPNQIEIRPFDVGSHHTKRIKLNRRTGSPL